LLDNGDDPGTLSLTLDTNGGYQLRSDSGQGNNSKGCGLLFCI